MRVAALYDVHGNLPALEAVLAEVEDADLILVGGDVVAGPFPAETLERLRAVGKRAWWIRGNADRVLGEPDDERPGGPPAELLAFVRSRLSEEQLAFVLGLPEQETIDVEGLGAVRFCHATPRNDEEIVTRITPDKRLVEVLSGVEESVVVAGHTHVQFDRMAGATRFVNAGSVGMPYEDRPGAYWALLGPDVELRRTDVDTSEAIAASDFPGDWPTASADEATEFFEQSTRKRG